MTAGNNAVAASTTTLDFTTLFAAFNAVVTRTDELRGSTMLSSAFYQRMATYVFMTFWEALTDTAIFGRSRKRLHVISAPAGAGKTTFSNACIAALVEAVPNSSALVVVEQIKTAETRYKDLAALLPSKVAC